MEQILAKDLIANGDAYVADSGVVSLDRYFATLDNAESAQSVHCWKYRAVKRAADFSAALLMMVVLLVPCALIAVAILLTSRGPLFYMEYRIGRNGHLFRIFKFRTMIPNAARFKSKGSSASVDAHAFFRMNKTKRDPRITAIGSILRTWSLDELPQLINVLRGDMSLVGPRPIIEAEVKRYGKWIDAYLDVKPGVTGLWQVSGRSTVDYDRRAHLDALYVQTWSLRNDLRILLRTLPAVYSRVGAQ